jgi:hypothetical protein
MIRNIIIILALLVVGAVFFMNQGFYGAKGNITKQDSLPVFPTSTLSSKPSIKLTLPSLTIPGTEAALSAKAWAIFQNYLEFAKAHNLTGLRSLSYQISATCNDQSKEKECFALMDSVYSIAHLFELGDFTHIQSDKRQIIMYTDGPTVATLYFTGDESGSLKVLGMRLCFEDKTTIGTCVKTDTLKNDSNSNGWWDQVESLFYSASLPK